MDKCLQLFNSINPSNNNNFKRTRTISGSNNSSAKPNNTMRTRLITLGTNTIALDE